jgi:hypothetical protein
MAFDSEEDFQAVLSSPEFGEAMEDSARFVARASSYVVDQIPVVASEGVGSDERRSRGQGHPGHRRRLGHRRGVRQAHRRRRRARRRSSIAPQAAAERVTAEISAPAARRVAVVADVAEEDSVAAMIKQTVDQLRPPRRRRQQRRRVRRVLDAWATTRSTTGATSCA